jgi:hypothetical protein
VRDCERGSPEGIAAAASAARFTHVLIKIADGNYTFNVDPKTRVDLVEPVVKALRTRGIQVWGWHYVYGQDPLGEARIAIQRLQQLNLDGYVIDAEIQYRETSRAPAARRFMAEMRRALPEMPFALSSFRFPTYHPQLPWREFLEYCDYNMPQVYWEKAHNPAAQMARCMREFQALVPYRPVIPTGPGYKWDGWRPTEQDLQEFLQAVTTHGCSAVNFFSWDECRRDLDNLWNLIAEHHFGEPAPDPLKDLPEQYIDALNRRQAAALTGLYRSDAVQVTGMRTIQGLASLRAWYEQFLSSQFPDATFTLTGKTGSGNSRHFTWRAVSPRFGAVAGSDTMGLIGGKIAYHYTAYHPAEKPS